MDLGQRDDPQHRSSVMNRSKHAARSTTHAADEKRQMSHAESRGSPRSEQITSGAAAREDHEVTHINSRTNHSQRTVDKLVKSKRRAKTTHEYYPSTRRSKSMWNEGVEFSHPDPARFQLPTLPSVNDLNSGMRDLEVWPSGNNTRLDASGSANNGPAGSSKLAKPKLLLELESYFDQQLFLLHQDDDDKFDSQRFQVYRNVFQFFIDRLHTYRPLLAAIKMEYELLLEDYLRRMQSIEPLRLELETLEKSLEEEIGLLISEHTERIEKLQKQTEAKDKDISRLKEEEGAMLIEIKSVEVSIQAIEERRQQVHQSNIALVGSLRFYEDWLQQFTRPENYEIMLKETQSEFTKALAEMQKLKKAVEGKIEREDLDEILGNMRSLREQIARKNIDIDRLQVNIDRTHKSCDALEVDVMKLEAQVTGLTPRPNWPALSMQSLEFSGNATSSNTDSLVVAVKGLQQDIMALRDKMPPELQSDDENEEADEDWVDMKFFEGKGYGENVPKYFQWEEPIANRKISKRDTELLIKHFWKQKDQVDAKRAKRMPVDEWLYEFLQRKYSTHAEITDWAYNLVDASLRYKYDADCEMFWKVITGQLDESVYWDEYEMTNGFIALLQKLDMQDHGGKVTGRLAKPTLLKAMRKWFDKKTDIRFNKLKRTLAKEEAAASSKVHYVHLFAEDKDFNQGPFAEMMRDQHLEERDEYLSDLDEALRERAKGENKTVNVQQCMAAILAIDPLKAERHQEQYVRSGLCLSKADKLDPEKFVLVDEFMQNLARGVVKTSTKRDEIDTSSLALST